MTGGDADEPARRPGRRALLLDLGGTVFLSGVEMLALLAEREPAVRAVAARRGPLGAEPDELWTRMLREEVSEREYWTRRGEEVGAALGRSWTLRDFMRTLYPPAAEILRPEAAELAADARAAGLRIGVLTNDLQAFHGDRLSAHPFLAAVDVLVDGSAIGTLKPDPRAYAVAAERLGAAPADIVFVDDMPWNVAGAHRAGMAAVEVDLTDPGRAFARARAALRLTERAA